MDISEEKKILCISPYHVGHFGRMHKWNMRNHEIYRNARDCGWKGLENFEIISYVDDDGVKRI